MLLITQYVERFESHPDGADICEADSNEALGAERMTFREVVELIRHGEPSSWPARGDISDWVTQYETNDGTRDYFESGARENTSIHYDRSNPARNAKWWKLAFRAAGLMKEGRI
jgi:hypothetical protein